MATKFRDLGLRQQVTGSTANPRLMRKTSPSQLSRARQTVDYEVKVQNFLGNTFELPAWVQAALKSGQLMPQIRQDETDQDHIQVVLGPVARQTYPAGLRATLPLPMTRLSRTPGHMRLRICCLPRLNKRPSWPRKTRAVVLHPPHHEEAHIEHVKDPTWFDIMIAPTNESDAFYIGVGYQTYPYKY